MPPAARPKPAVSALASSPPAASKATPSNVTVSSWSVKPLTTPSVRVSFQQRHSVVASPAMCAAKAASNVFMA